MPTCLERIEAPMEIFRIPVLSDNYVFLLHDPERRECVVIDPAIADPVLRLLAQLQSTLVGIWNTHHHHDHIGGNRALLKKFPQAEVVAGAYDRQRGRIPGQTKVVAEGDVLAFADREVRVLDCPGHTLGHIAYYFPPINSDPHLFCGDTLFAGGCGRLFEGKPSQMMASLAKFQALPPETQIWCAHEYTLNNLKFAVTLESDLDALNNRLAEVSAARQQDEPTVPSMLSVELATNPFLRCHDPMLQQAMGCDRPLELFATIRKLKDRF